MGIVAHYYIDVELQGILQAMKEEHSTSVAIADSLAMGDYAVKICENGATSIACVGVDFMDKSVRSICLIPLFSKTKNSSKYILEIYASIIITYKRNHRIAYLKKLHLQKVCCKNLLQLKTLTEKL